MFTFFCVKNQVSVFSPQGFGEGIYSNPPYNSPLHGKLLAKLNFAFHELAFGGLINRDDDGEAGGRESSDDCDHETKDSETLFIA